MAGQLEPWLRQYLSTPAWANAGLLEFITSPPRFFHGPLELSLNELVRLSGPEEGMQFPEEASLWERRVTEIRATLRDQWSVPPVLLATRCGRLRRADGSLYFEVLDGNHRVEAYRREGLAHIWGIICFESDALRREYLQGRAP